MNHSQVYYGFVSKEILSGMLFSLYQSPRSGRTKSVPIFPSHHSAFTLLQIPLRRHQNSFELSPIDLQRGYFLLIYWLHIAYHHVGRCGKRSNFPGIRVVFRSMGRYTSLFLPYFHLNCLQSLSFLRNLCEILSFTAERAEFYNCDFISSME